MPLAWCQAWFFKKNVISVQQPTFTPLSPHPWSPCPSHQWHLQENVWLRLDVGGQHQEPSFLGDPLGLSTNKLLSPRNQLSLHRIYLNLLCHFLVYLALNTSKCSVTLVNEEISGEYQMECPKTERNRCSRIAKLCLVGTFVWVQIMRLQFEKNARHKHVFFIALPATSANHSGVAACSQETTPLNHCRAYRAYITPALFFFFWNVNLPCKTSIIPTLAHDQEWQVTAMQGWAGKNLMHLGSSVKKKKKKAKTHSTQS